MTVFINKQGNSYFSGTATEYDQVDYQGALADYVFTRNDDGSVTAAHPTLGTDTLTNIDGFWFGGEAQWYSLDQAIELTAANADPVVFGTNGDDTLIGSGLDNTFVGSSGDDIIDGNGGDYNQVDYDGNLSDYTFELNEDGTVTVVHPEFGTDTLTDIDGFWLTGEQAWYSVEQAIELAGAAPSVIEGTSDDDRLFGANENNVFIGSAGNDVIFGRGGDYNQVDYNGNLSDYTFGLNDNGTVKVFHPEFGIDTLTNIDGFWFSGEEAWYSLEQALQLAPSGVEDVLNGPDTTASIEAGGSLTGEIDRPGDVDWFLIDGEPGQTLRFSVEGAGATNFVVDADRNILVDPGTEFGVGDTSSEDIFFTIPDDGDYFLSVNGSSFRGSFGLGEYSVTSEILIDDHGDDFATATSVATDGSVLTGTISAPSDVDVFALDLTEGQAIQIDLDVPIEDDIVPLLRLVDGQGNVLAELSSSGALDYTASATGQVFLQIEATDSNSLTFEDQVGDYTLSVTDTGAAPSYIEGTSGDDHLIGSDINNVFLGGAGDDVINGNGGDYNQADYFGSISEYAIFANDDGSYTVSHAEGTDTLTDIDGFWFGEDQQWYSLESAIAATPDDFFM